LPEISRGEVYRGFFSEEVIMAEKKHPLRYVSTAKDEYWWPNHNCRKW